MCCCEAWFHNLTAEPGSRTMVSILAKPRSRAKAPCHKDTDADACSQLYKLYKFIQYINIFIYIHCFLFHEYGGLKHPRGSISHCNQKRKPGPPMTPGSLCCSKNLSAHRHSVQFSGVARQQKISGFTMCMPRRLRHSALDWELHLNMQGCRGTQARRTNLELACHGFESLIRNEIAGPESWVTSCYNYDITLPISSKYPGRISWGGAWGSPTWSHWLY